MNQYMTDLFSMHLNNKEELYETIKYCTEDSVETEEEETRQISVMMDHLRDLFDVVTAHAPKGGFLDDILHAAKGQIDYLKLAKEYIANYKNGDM